MAGELDLPDVSKTDPLNDIKGYEADQINIDSSTDTVEGRVQGIIEKNSAPMQLAKSRALQGMNSRGLANSSMAVGAAENAVYDYATPIATQDAQSSLQVKGANVSANNTAFGANAAAVNSAAAQQEAGNQQTREIDQTGNINSRIQQEGADQAQSQAVLDQQIKSTLQSEQYALEQNLAAFNNDHATELARIKGQYDLLTQANQSAAAFYSQVSAAMGAILSNPDIDSTEKQGLIDHELRLLASGMAVIGGMADLDIGGLLDFGGGTPTTGSGGWDYENNRPLPGGGTPTPTPPPANPNISDADLRTQLNDLYKEVLGRDIGDAGWAAYSEAYRTGATLEQIKAILETSDEKAGQAAANKPPTGANNPVVTDSDLKNSLNAIYKEVLGRDIGEEGTAFYTKLYRSGKATLEQIKAQIAGSQEAAARTGGMTTFAPGSEQQGPPQAGLINSGIAAGAPAPGAGTPPPASGTRLPIEDSPKIKAAQARVAANKIKTDKIRANTPSEADVKNGMLAKMVADARGYGAAAQQAVLASLIKNNGYDPDGFSDEDYEAYRKRDAEIRAG